MNVGRLAQLLEEMAELMELAGENPFRCNAYIKGARSVAENAAQLDAALEEDRLTELPGIGKGLAEKTREFAETGHIAELDEFRSRIPAGLVQLTRVPGLGPKKARLIFETLGIDSVEGLKIACEDGRVAALKGLGEKTAAKIVAGICQMQSSAGRFRLDDALAMAETVLAYLRNQPTVLQAEIAGSLRRRKEIIADIDIVVSTEHADAVMESFRTYPGATEVIGSGPTKTSIRLFDRVQADLRCVTPAQFPFALLHFTGSKEHNTRLRGRAKELGLKLNEYGLFPEGIETSLAAASEPAVYTHLGLAFIEPEMREDMGEVDAAAERRLPTLVTPNDIRGITHMHTIASDGTATLEQYAEWALAHGIQWMGITDHSRSLVIANGLSGERLMSQGVDIDTLNGVYTSRGVRLLKGIECDILADGSLDYTDPILRKLDFVIISIHQQFKLPPDVQTERMVKGLANPHATIIGHMTGRLLLSRDGYAIDQEAVIRAAGERGIAIEINGNPRRLDLDWRLVRRAVDAGCMIALSPDAHAIDGLEDLQYSLWMARKGWCSPDQIVNCMNADDFIAFANRRRPAGVSP